MLSSGISAGILTLIARQEIEYLTPVPYQRHPWMSRCGSAGWAARASRSATRCAALASAAPDGTQTVYARATTVVVKVDARSGAPLRLSAEERAAWEPYVGPPLIYAHRR